MERARIKSANALVAGVVILGSLSGCNFDRNKLGGAGHPVAGQSWYPWIQQAIIGPKCVSCHASGNPSGGIDLSSYQKIMDSRSVIPFKPEQSLFYTSIHPSCTGPKCMPKGAPPLTTEEVGRVYEWIKKGAGEQKDPPAPTPTPPPPPPPKPEPKFSWIAKHIFAPKCVECHQGRMPKGETDLTTYAKLMDSSGVRLKPVAPGDPLDSGIYDQIVSAKMPPPPAAKLSTEEINAVRDWIKAGAKND